MGDVVEKLEGRFTSGESLDGKGENNVGKAEPLGDEPMLAPPALEAFAQEEQVEGADDEAPPTTRVPARE